MSDQSELGDPVNKIDSCCREFNGAPIHESAAETLLPNICPDNNCADGGDAYENAEPVGPSPGSESYGGGPCFIFPFKLA